MSKNSTPAITPGTYRHTKSGKYYEVLGVAFHTETEDYLVIYKPLYESSFELFARPIAMFFEQIEHNGYARPRFEQING